MEQANMNKGCGKQAVPLIVEDEPGIVCAVVEQGALGRILGVDTVCDHPEVDGDVDGEQEVSAGCRAWVPGAEFAVAADLFGRICLGRQVLRAGRNNLAFGMRLRGGHGCLLTLSHFCGECEEASAIRGLTPIYTD